MMGKSCTWWKGKALAVLVVMGLLLSSPAAWSKSSKGGSPPDYTKGDKPNDSMTKWALGSTGALGFIHNNDATQILIEEVAPGSPAEGKLKKGDVILGVETAGAKVAFTKDARQLLASAIQQAESKAGKGTLVLNIWREGNTSPVALTLPVLGAFSSTAPWKCAKTDALIDQAAKSIVDGGLFKEHRGKQVPRQTIWSNLDALGLLATGEEKYIALVRDYARVIAKGEEDGEGGMNTWGGSYKNVLLTEYYLTTGDKVVLPGITRLATRLARGVSGVGTWSHGTADIEKNGMYGPPGAYGAMNQASMVCALSRVLMGR